MGLLSVNRLLYLYFYMQTVIVSVSVCWACVLQKQHLKAVVAATAVALSFSAPAPTNAPAGCAIPIHARDEAGAWGYHLPILLRQKDKSSNLISNN